MPPRLHVALKGSHRQRGSSAQQPVRKSAAAAPGRRSESHGLPSTWRRCAGPLPPGRVACGAGMRTPPPSVGCSPPQAASPHTCPQPVRQPVRQHACRPGTTGRLLCAGGTCGRSALSGQQMRAAKIIRATVLPWDLRTQSCAKISFSCDVTTITFQILQLVLGVK